MEDTEDRRKKAAEKNGVRTLQKGIEDIKKG
jgi:hypothetical protein